MSSRSTCAPPHKLLYVRQRRAVSAHQAMPAQLIHFSALTPRGCRRCGIVVVLNDLIAQLRLKPPLEIERRQIQLRQLGSQQVKIPRALIGLIVHQAQGVHLLRRQIIDADAGHLNHAQLLRRQGAAVTNDDHAGPVYHDRLHKAKLPDALRHVSHLRGVVPFGVGAIRCQLRQRPALDSHKVTSRARFGHRHLRLCGTGGQAARTEEKGEEYFRGCPPRKTAVYSGIARRFSRPRAARHRADAEIAGMSWTPSSSNKDARSVFSRGGYQSHRSGVRGGADGAYCRWLSGCSSS